MRRLVRFLSEKGLSSARRHWQAQSLCLGQHAAVAALFVLMTINEAVAERTVTINRATTVCTSWAAWREYGQASLTSRGARMSNLCPIRLPRRTKVIVVDDDAGEGAAEIRHRGRTWFIDAQRLD